MDSHGIFWLGGSHGIICYNPGTEDIKTFDERIDALEKKTQEVEQMAQKLHEADETKLRFFANISHEFRTPLTLILAPLDKYVKIKELDHINDWYKINTNLQLMQRNAKRLLRLINQIIDFRKLDHE